MADCTTIRTLGWLLTYQPRNSTNTSFQGQILIALPAGMASWVTRDDHGSQHRPNLSRSPRGGVTGSGRGRRPGGWTAVSTRAP